MTRLPTYLRAYLLALLICSVPMVAANPVAELQSAGRLQVSSNISPDQNLVPGQKIKLTVEIATDRWFSGGTRITIPEIPGLVILQTEKFASNASETRNGQSWVIQRWTLDVFAQRVGDFTIEPLKLHVQVNADEAGAAEGELWTTATHFSTAIPESLSQAEHWVAAPDFNVRQSFDRLLEDLEVGDAFEWEIVFEATEVLAMMLPHFTASKLPGLAAYPAPPVLANSSNRGQTQASRTQRIGFVVEAQGHYALPAQDYFWWDTTNAQLKLLSLPATEFTVGAGTAAANKRTVDISPRQLSILAIGFVLLAGLLLLVWKWRLRLPMGRAQTALSNLWQQLQQLRKSGLPRRLNPDSNAGE
ncbi:MAG: BatD family protein [Halioglobus sp.]